MKKTVRLYTTIGFLAALATTVFLLETAGVRRMVIAGTAVSILLGAVWVASLFGWVENTVGNTCLFLMLAGIVLTVLGSQNLLQRSVPFCGDGVCSARECTTGCEDCNPADCEDGQCIQGFEDCSNSEDCICAGESVCAPGREQTDVRGCAPVQCGDGFCDDGFEDRFNCCRDCGCLPDYECENNICFFRQPMVTFTPYIAAQELSVTSLAANPRLRNASGTHPLMALTMRVAQSPAERVNVTFALGDLLEEQVSVGTVRPGKEEYVLWYPTHKPTLLRIENTTTTNLTVTVTYVDAQENKHRNDWAYGMTLLGRNNMDRFGSIVFFVTPDDIEMAGTPEQIWNSLRNDIRLGTSEGTQFPIETLERGVGSGEDIAVLLASAYLSAGHKTSLVESEHGIFVRVWDRNNFVILDPERIGESYRNAQSTRPGYAVHELNGYWEENNVTQLSISRTY